MQYIVLLFLLFIYTSSAIAQTKLTIEDAERLFMANNLELKAKRAELKKNDAEVIRARIMPNPTLRYSRDSLRNGEWENEERYSISQSIDIVSKRPLRISSAEKRRDASYLLFEQEAANSLALMKQTYYRILLLDEHRAAIRNTMETFAEVERKTGERFKAGDVAEVELMKIIAERKRFARVLSGMESESKMERSRLGLLLNIDNAIAVRGQLRRSPLKLSRDELISMAMQKRADIKAQSFLVEAAGTTLSLSKREMIMPIEIEAGYKRRTGGFNGFILGISIPIPLFNRNRDGVVSAAAGLETKKIRQTSIVRSVLHEIQVLYEKINSLSARIHEMEEQLKQLKDITIAIHTAYEEGEASLMELLDAVRSQTEHTIEYNSLVYGYSAALIDMERTIGSRIVESRGIK